MKTFIKCGQEKDEKLGETDLCRSRHRDTTPKGQLAWGINKQIQTQSKK